MKKDWMIKESELDEDQIKVLMATLDKSCLVTGCAGSGKSVLALIKAQRERTYKLNGKVIAKNRKPRFEQQDMALSQWYEQQIEVLGKKESPLFYTLKEGSLLLLDNSDLSYCFSVS